MQIDHEGFLQKKIKIRSWDHDLLLEFWDPSISQNRFKLNLARGLASRISYDRR